MKDLPLHRCVEGNLVNNNINKHLGKENLLDWISKVGCTEELAEKFKQQLIDNIESFQEMKEHCCQVFSCAMGMNVVDMSINLSNHYSKEFCSETGKWEYSQFIVHFVEERDDPDNPVGCIRATYEYKFSPRTRRGKILRHCYWILRVIAEIEEAKNHIILLHEDEQEWERDLLLGDV